MINTKARLGQQRPLALADLPLQSLTHTCWHHFSTVSWQQKTSKHHKKQEEVEKKSKRRKEVVFQKQSLVHGGEEVQTIKVQEKPWKEKTKIYLINQLIFFL
ncbi:Uncharacterized protein TCM_042402 [Theobroma cacao]|uniref:Uncharacterized protein n=1 Tax=Theobroma cacao TaxID=3641 RepID=A0A061FL40_THECC|nr:Uncharacterized protein TCM_042402 [Theobroma cacao]